MECSTVKKSGLVRNLALGDWSNSVRRDLELGWPTAGSLRSSAHTHTQTESTLSHIGRGEGEGGGAKIPPQHAAGLGLPGMEGCRSVSSGGTSLAGCSSGLPSLVMVRRMLWYLWGGGMHPHAFVGVP